MAMGGHLVPGNLVSLCRRCNGLKRDKAPAAFYTDEELARLPPLFEAQKILFAFAFDCDKWAANREAYLLELGLEERTVNAALHDEDFYGYIEPVDDRPSFSFKISIDFPTDLP